MIIRNETKLTKELNIQYSSHLILQSQKKTLAIIAIVVILLGVSTAIYFNLIFGIILAVIGALLPFAVYFGLIALIKKKYHELNPEGLAPTLVFAFYDKYFEAAPKEQPHMMYRCQFKDFFQINETKHLFIFQVDEKQAYYVSKKCFTAGSEADLKELLKSVESYNSWK